MTNSSDVVGLVPAAGFANRISPLPCSKEIYPIMHPDGKPRVVSSCLLESYKKANVKQAYLVLRSGKWDIPEYFEEGESLGLSLAYIVSKATGGVPQTIDKAYPFIKNNRVVFGFPDILFQPLDAFNVLLQKQKNTGADLVLGLFSAINHEKMDMVDFNSDGELTDIIIKPVKTKLTHTWIIAVWTSAFSTYLHKYIEADNPAKSKEELHIGDIFREAIYDGLKTDYVKFDGAYLDIGTPGELKKANNSEFLETFYADN